jgi:hypothetical protein
MSEYMANKIHLPHPIQSPDLPRDREISESLPFDYSDSPTILRTVILLSCIKHSKANKVAGIRKKTDSGRAERSIIKL